MIRCDSCNVEFTSKKGLSQHMKGKRHITRANGTQRVLDFACSCGRNYSHRQSLHVHRMTCTYQITHSVTEMFEDLKHTMLEERKYNQIERERSKNETGELNNVQKDALSVQEIVKEMKQAFELERKEMKAQIAMLLDKHAGTTNNTTNNNNIETQNITININAFGNENTDYLDDKAILACIGRVYKSIPSLLEKIHFDPKHPENHNIKITNKKLPYASVMGNNQKWKTVDRKDAIETMVLNGYNMLDEKYAENKEKIPASKQQNFEGFQSKFESEDKEIMKQIKTEVDMMVLNGV